MIYKQSQLSRIRQAINYSASEPYLYNDTIITSCFFDEVDRVREMIGNQPSVIMAYAEPDIRKIPELAQVIVTRKDFCTSLTFLTNWEFDRVDKMTYRGETVLSDQNHALKAGSTASNIDLLISTRDAPFHAVRYVLMASQMSARKFITETLNKSGRSLYHFLNRVKVMPL